MPGRGYGPISYSDCVKTQIDMRFLVLRYHLTNHSGSKKTHFPSFHTVCIVIGRGLFVGGDCGCAVLQHSHDCPLKEQGGAGWGHSHLEARASMGSRLGGWLIASKNRAISASRI